MFFRIAKGYSSYNILTMECKVFAMILVLGGVRSFEVPNSDIENEANVSSKKMFDDNNKSTDGRNQSIKEGMFDIFII